jgi:hypothetical protein
MNSIEERAPKGTRLFLEERREPLARRLAVMFGLSSIMWVAIIAALHLLTGCGGAGAPGTSADLMVGAADDAAPHPVTEPSQPSAVPSEAGAETQDSGLVMAEAAAPVVPSEDAGPDTALSKTDAEAAPETGISATNEALCCQQCQNLAYNCQVANCGGTSCLTCTAGYHTCSQTHCNSGCP